MRVWVIKIAMVSYLAKKRWLKKGIAGMRVGIWLGII